MLNLLEIYKQEFGKTKKSLGQHFLTNTHIMDKIIESANIVKGSKVLEIGPGCGVLTYRILEKGAELLAVEIDGELVNFLKRYLHYYQSFNIVHSDFTKIDGSILHGKYIFVGNLPYYIAVQILEKCTELIDHVESLVFMFQREVAERIISPSKTKSYSSLSVFCQYFFEIKRVMNISGANFYPNAKVESTVLRFIPRKREFSENDEKAFLSLVKSSFLSKRKMLKNNLKGVIDISLIPLFFKRDNVRAEELSLVEFIEFFRFLRNVG
ncbi:MAG: 16S rRNA (adenine(1518)-N(6)/adenine(1519)-N(6))-dimethyltransferase RsmA [Calditerrivibrio sp.]|nr:16S rRNA (adenine(1518)-N(6)/adenine(1519)-N(6))-dimethyltransferase RsmA [Calditerrivibrio sp.]